MTDLDKIYKRLDEQDEKVQKLLDAQDKKVQEFIDKLSDKLSDKLDKVSKKVDETYDKVFLYDGLIVDVNELKKEKDNRLKLGWMVLAQIILVPLTLLFVLIKAFLGL